MFTAIEAENPIRYFANGVEENYVVITPNGDVKPIIILNIISSASASATNTSVFRFRTVIRKI